MKKVAVVLGSDSDLPVMEKCAATLKQFDVPFTLSILSAHRTPDEAREFFLGADADGYGVIIAAAGYAAHLAGSAAAYTALPVIGVPIASGPLNGIDALYSTVMMPSGVPVATVAVNGSVNAALLAIQILALSDKGLADKLQEYRLLNKNKTLEKNKNLSVI